MRNIMLFQAMQKIGARNTSIISTIEPVFTNVFSMMLLGEILTGQRIVGGVLILAGVIVLDRLGYSPDSTISATSSIGWSSPISKSPGTDEGKS
jgi:Predicted membrane protein